MYSYCLVCQSIHTKGIIASVQAIAPCRVISPTIIQRKWVRGEAVSEPHPYFPGYLFIYSENVIPDFYTIRGVLGVIRILGAETGQYELEGNDLKFADMLWSCDGIIGIQQAIEEGDQVRLVEGPFADLVGSIIRLDRKKKRAKVQFTFDKTVYNLWVGLDILEHPKPEKEKSEAANSGTPKK